MHSNARTFTYQHLILLILFTNSFIYSLIHLWFDLIQKSNIMVLFVLSSFYPCNIQKHNPDSLFFFYCHSFSHFVVCFCFVGFGLGLGLQELNKICNLKNCHLLYWYSINMLSVFIIPCKLRICALVDVPTSLSSPGYTLLFLHNIIFSRKAYLPPPWSQVFSVTKRFAVLLQHPTHISPLELTALCFL